MAKVTTNFVEIMLRSALIGKTIYLDDDVTAITVQDLNYEPKIRTVYIYDGTDNHKLNIDKYFDMEDGTRTKRQPDRRIRGKNVRGW